MKRSDDIEHTLSPFRAPRRAGKLAYLVGAGVSRDRPSGRPLAREISRAVLTGLVSQCRVASARLSTSAMDALLANLRFERMVQVLADTTGSVGFLRVLRGGRPNRTHRALARALSDGCPILTTNFDRLLERALPERNKATVLATSEDFRGHGRRTPRRVLAKLHGSIENESSLCATLGRVGSLGPAFMWDPPRGEYLKRLREGFPMAVLGYSGFDDIDVVPRLAITASGQPLLWVLHEESTLRTATRADIARLATAPGLSEFLKSSAATVLVGSTRSAAALLEGHAELDPPDPVGVAWLQERCLRYLGFGAAPLVHDFVMGRLLYEGGRYPHALKVLSETRTAAQHRHPGIALRCAVNEATLRSALGDNARALDLLESSLPHLRSSTDDWTWANAVLNRAVLMRSTASPEDAEKATRSARRAIAGEPDLRVLWATATPRGRPWFSHTVSRSAFPSELYDVHEPAGGHGQGAKGTRFLPDRATAMTRAAAPGSTDGHASIDALDGRQRRPLCGENTLRRNAQQDARLSCSSVHRWYAADLRSGPSWTPWRWC